MVTGALKRKRKTCSGLLLLLLACGEPSSIELAPIADGLWTVLAVREDGPLFTRGQTREPAYAVLGDTLETVQLYAGSDINRDRITHDTLTIDGLGLTRVGDHYLAPNGRPYLYRSPTHPDRYAFEHEDAIWIFDASDSTLHKLTQDEDVAELRAKQREGEVILYWSVNPVWSADGHFISFLSNREALRADARNSQSVWLIDTGTGEQRPLLYKEGVSYHVDGVLGDEFLLTSSEAPGVHAVDPRSGVLRAVHDGYLLASHAGGSAALINHDGRLVVVRADARDTIAPPPAGWGWGSARFSPSGERIALYASDGAGQTMLHVVLRDGTQLTAPLPGPPMSGPDWASDDDVIFAAAPRGQPIRTYRATLR